MTTFYNRATGETQDLSEFNPTSTPVYGGSQYSFQKSDLPNSPETSRVTRNMANRAGTAAANNVSDRVPSGDSTDFKAHSKTASDLSATKEFVPNRTANFRGSFN